MLSQMAQLHYTESNISSENVSISRTFQCYYFKNKTEFAITSFHTRFYISVYCKEIYSLSGGTIENETCTSFYVQRGNGREWGVKVVEEYSAFGKFITDP
jgi:hypothetical protein